MVNFEGQPNIDELKQKAANGDEDARNDLRVLGEAGGKRTAALKRASITRDVLELLDNDQPTQVDEDGDVINPNDIRSEDKIAAAVELARASSDMVGAPNKLPELDESISGTIDKIKERLIRLAGTEELGKNYDSDSKKA